MALLLIIRHGENHYVKKGKLADLVPNVEQEKITELKGQIK